MVDGDEAGDKGEALDDQRHRIVEQAGDRQRENAAFDKEQQQKRPDHHQPGEHQDRRRHGEAAAHAEIEHDAADDPARQRRHKAGLQAGRPVDGVDVEDGVEEGIHSAGEGEGCVAEKDVNGEGAQQNSAQPDDPVGRLSREDQQALGAAQAQRTIEKGEEAESTTTPEELEEILIMADIGMDTTVEIIDRLKDKIRKEKINDVELVRPALKEVILEIMTENDDATEEALPGEKEVMLVIGVNGVGKTTSIGKLAAKNKAEGKKVLLAAADTFRAGAIDQLVVWSERAKVDIVKHEEGSDPAAVVFDAINASKSRNVDLLICDTAGRLHNKKNLMDELGKINRIIDRELSDARKETLLVLDATTGQNAVMQAKQFSEVCPIDGIILTKLDGTAKGGIVISIKNTLKMPVRYIGVGEGIEDLQEFDAESFVEALF